MNEPPPARILVVDDEPQFRRALRVILRGAGYEPVLAEHAEEALDIASVRMPDAVLTDLRMPGADGVELTARLREFSQVPILVLSMVGDEQDKIRALDAGADDYVTKPFSADELLARLRSNLRRGAPSPEEAAVECGDLRIDLAAHQVTRAGEAVDLTPTEWNLLALLVRNRPKLMTHRMILAEVWGPGYGDDSHIVRQQVANLRAKIEPDRSRASLVVTAPGVGYRFAG